MDCRRFRPSVRGWARQAALAGVLAVCLAAAAGVVRWQRHRMRTVLEAPAVVAQGPAQFSVQLPRDWNRKAASDGIVAESNAPGAARALYVRRLQLSELSSPLRLLYEIGLMRGDGNDQAFEPVVIDGWPGLKCRTLIRSRSPDGAAIVRRVYGAAVITPAREAIIVRLEATGASDASEADMFARVIASVTLADSAPAKNATAELEWRGGARVRPGDISATLSWRTQDHNSPYELWQQISARDGEGWVGIELVPCVFLPDDQPETFAAMLALRHPAEPTGGWLATIKRLDAHTLVSRRHDPSGDVVLSVLYCADDGQALLADMRLDLLPESRERALMSAMQTAIAFGPTSDIAERLARGAKYARRVRIAADSLITSAAEDAVRLSYRDWPGSSRTASLLVWTPADEAWNGALVGVDASSGAQRTLATWQIDTRAHQYRFESHEPEPTADIDAQYPVTAPATRPAFVAQFEPAPPTTRVSSPSTASTQDSVFVPGALLAALVSAFPPPDEALILRTESCPALDPAALPGLMTLIIRPGDDRPRYTDPAPDADRTQPRQPMRSVAVEISGTGNLTRWYFDEKGSLRFIDRAGGEHLQFRPLAEAELTPAREDE